MCFHDEYSIRFFYRKSRNDLDCRCKTRRKSYCTGKRENGKGEQKAKFCENSQKKWAFPILCVVGRLEKTRIVPLTAIGLPSERQGLPQKLANRAFYLVIAGLLIVEGSGHKQKPEWSAAQ
jgi:hypothetical protein